MDGKPAQCFQKESVMEKLDRYEVFAPGLEGERAVARFWIAGSLKTIEERAARENAPTGCKPTVVECVLAASMALAAIATVLTLL